MAAPVYCTLSRKLHEVLIDSWGCGEMQENGVEVLIKVFSTCTYCACFPSIVSWASQEAGPSPREDVWSQHQKYFLGSGYWFINKSTPGQRPSVLMAWVMSPLHLPWSLWIRPTEHKPPVLPAGEGRLQRAVPCPRGAQYSAHTQHRFLCTFSTELPSVGSVF